MDVIRLSESILLVGERKFLATNTGIEPAGKSTVVGGLARRTITKFLNKETEKFSNLATEKVHDVLFELGIKINQDV